MPDVNFVQMIEQNTTELEPRHIIIITYKCILSWLYTELRNVTQSSYTASRNSRRNHIFTGTKNSLLMLSSVNLTDKWVGHISHPNTTGTLLISNHSWNIQTNLSFNLGSILMFEAMPMQSGFSCLHDWQ